MYYYISAQEQHDDENAVLRLLESIPVEPPCLESEALKNELRIFFE